MKRSGIRLMLFALTACLAAAVSCGGRSGDKDGGPAFDYLRPEVTVVASPAAAAVGDTVTITVIAGDDIGVESVSLLVDGQHLALDGSGQAQFAGSAAGIFEVVASAADAYGNEGRVTSRLRVLETGDVSFPTVSIDSPAAWSTVTSAVNIIGTVSDANLARFELEISVAGEGEYRVFASGASSLAATVLGVLDPAQLRDGIYDVRLKGEDTSGNFASVRKTYLIETASDPAACQTVAVDLSLPSMAVAGEPLTVARVHDSRLWTGGDFGMGWRWQARDVQVYESGVLGDGWDQSSTGGPFIETFIITPQWPHLVRVSVGNETGGTFQAGPSPDSQALIPIQFPSMQFAADTAGISLAAQDLSGDLLVNPTTGPVQLLDLDFFEVYDPDRYLFTDQDGVEYSILQADGAYRIADSAGAIIDFTQAGAFHSNGEQLDIARDGQGRITQVDDGYGNVIDYTYDFYGCLVRVQDQDGGAVVYRYGPGNELIEALVPE